MSRIGKQPIALPEKVKLDLTAGNLKVTGPMGEKSLKFPESIKLETVNGFVNVTNASTERDSGSMWGLYRTLISNLIVGVSKGYVRTLEFTGVGYKAAVSGSTLNLSLGFSHQIDFPLPKGVTAKVEKNSIALSSFDKELLGMVAAKIRSLRPPEPYKGKGIKYSEEKIRRKAGKTGAKK